MEKICRLEGCEDSVMQLEDTVFPQDSVKYKDGYRPCSGLTKREYFAGQALQGFFSGVPYQEDGVDDPNFQIELSHAAKLCVAAADALIEALNK